MRQHSMHKIGKLKSFCGVGAIASVFCFMTSSAFSYGDPDLRAAFDYY